MTNSGLRSIPPYAIWGAPVSGCTCRTSSERQRPIEVRFQIIDIFDADREPDQ